MAKVLNRILGFIGLEEDDEEYEEEQMSAAPEQEYSYSRNKEARPQQINYEEYNGASQSRSRKASSTAKDNKVISVYKNNGTSNLIIYRPASCDDSAHMIDSIKNNKPVIANFENIDSAKAQRILDMMSGAMYAISGNVHKVSKSIYVFVPENIDVDGDARVENSRAATSISNLYMDFSK